MSTAKTENYAKNRPVEKGVEKVENSNHSVDKRKNPAVNIGVKKREKIMTKQFTMLCWNPENPMQDFFFFCHSGRKSLSFPKRTKNGRYALTHAVTFIFTPENTKFCRKNAILGETLGKIVQSDVDFQKEKAYNNGYRLSFRRCRPVIGRLPENLLETGRLLS